MITIRLIVILFIGIVFTLISFFIFRKKKVLGAIFFIIGLSLIFIRFGPLAISREKVYSIKNIDSTEVLNIKIYALGFNKIKPEADIYDRVTINKLSAALVKSTEEGEQFMKSLHSKYVVVVQFKSKKEILFEVKTKDHTTGLNVCSTGKFGWHYGDLHADSFGEELEKITSK